MTSNFWMLMDWGTQKVGNELYAKYFYGRMSKTSCFGIRLPGVPITRRVRESLLMRSSAWREDNIVR